MNFHRPLPPITEGSLISRISKPARLTKVFGHYLFSGINYLTEILNSKFSIRSLSWTLSWTLSLPKGAEGSFSIFNSTRQHKPIIDCSSIIVNSFKTLHNSKFSIHNYTRSYKLIATLINCLIVTLTLAQQENVTLTSTTVTRPSTLTEEAIFTIKDNTSVTYTIQGTILDEPQSTVLFEAGSEVYLTGEFEVQEGATFCINLNPAGDNFTRLKDELDGSFYKVQNGVLRLIIEEDYYANAETVSLKIYSEQGTELFSNGSINKNTGVNGFELDLRSQPSFTEGNFYLVEVTNKKNIKKVLRIKFPENNTP